ncbi:MAG: OmpA family protein [Bacteroidota bacterium]|nr:OmpA family protein [Bacteroidota bacterium]
MKKVISLYFILLLGNISLAQNLVMNPGFEEHGEITGNGPGSDNMRGNHVISWLSPTDASPDYFVRGNDYLFNQYGPPQSHSGEAMAGIAVFGGKTEYREYIIGEFSAPLEAGVTYDFSIAIALAAYSGKMIDEFGVCITTTRILDKKISSSLKLIPQIIIDSTDQENVNGKWMVFHETFTALGGEKFITIGNFSSDKKTKSKKINGEKGAPYAYYYLDDISLSPQGNISIDETLTIIENPVETLKIAAGKTLVVDNVYFEVDKSILKEESFPVLDEIIAALKDQPELNVEIDGHTDSDGTNEHNQKLSEDRAKSVEAYFISKGIDASRISTNGFGSSRPVGMDKNKNRRVEFIFSD